MTGDCDPAAGWHKEGDGNVPLDYKKTENRPSFLQRSVILMVSMKRKGVFHV